MKTSTLGHTTTKEAKETHRDSKGRVHSGPWKLNVDPTLRKPSCKEKKQMEYLGSLNILGGDLEKKWRIWIKLMLIIEMIKQTKCQVLINSRGNKKCYERKLIMVTHSLNQNSILW